MTQSNLQCCVDRVAPEPAVHLEPPFHTIISRNTTRGIVMKQIPLTKGMFALVDDDMYDYLMQWKWHVSQGTSTWYAERTENGQRFKMHRVIMNVPKGMDTDHINHNGLDNRIENLRICTRREHCHTIRPKAGRYKGVTFCKRNTKWHARIFLHRRRATHLGFYEDAANAARAYDAAVIKHYDKYAYTNFPRGEPE